MAAILLTAFSNAFSWMKMYGKNFVHKDPIINIPAFVRMMAWRRSGDKPLSEPTMVVFPTHIYSSPGLSELTHNTFVNRCKMAVILFRLQCVNALRSRQNGRISQTTFSSAFYWMKIYELQLIIHWSFVPKGPINNIAALVQIMGRRRPGDKPLSEPMLVSLPTHICVIRPQWINCRSPLNETENNIDFRGLRCSYMWSRWYDNFDIWKSR